MQQKTNLNLLNVALMFVGAIMGAGFASGREIWQFFGVFGRQGRIGILLIAVLFVVLGMMTAYLARILGTNDMGRIIAPGGNPKIENLVSWFMAIMLFTVLINMTAAGGALLHQNFGISRLVGGVLIGVLVIVTVLGEFERISKVFRYIMPVLFAAVILISVLAVTANLGASAQREPVKPSPIAGNWVLAACLYISYNILAMIPIVATSSVNAKSEKSAMLGSGLGGIFLGVLAFTIVLALQKDMQFAQAMDMPMLAYAGRISKGAGIIYSVLLFAAIYASATSNFYGFTTKLRTDEKKSRKVILSACLAFLLGLVGFKNVVAYMFPIEGYLGFAIIAMLLLNFAQVRRRERRRKLYQKDMRRAPIPAFFENFAGHDRTDFPRPLVRVTGGPGGEAILILGSEKTALYDCGMACFADNLIENLKTVLNAEGKTLDYILLSHTHYDHIGALPYVLQVWPEAQVCGLQKAKEVFAHPNARATMERLGNNAKALYGVEGIEITAAGMRVDRVLADGDSISLGAETITAYETKGHTDCSASYLLSPEKILFTSESTGMQVTSMLVQTSPLKSYDDCFASAARLKTFDVNDLILPHYGRLPSFRNQTYFDDFIKEAELEQHMLEEAIRQGLSDDELLQLHMRRYWSEKRNKAQPFAAYALNTQIIIRQLRKKLNIPSEM